MGERYTDIGIQDVLSRCDQLNVEFNWIAKVAKSDKDINKIIDFAGEMVAIRRLQLNMIASFINLRTTGSKESKNTQSGFIEIKPTG